MLTSAKKLDEKLPGVKVMPTAVRMTRKVYKRAFLGNELLQKGDAPIKGRFSWACITGELDRNKGHWFGLTRPDVLNYRKHQQDSENETNERKQRAVMAQIQRERQDDKRASAWLAKHSPKAKPKPKPKPRPLERWQMRVRAQKQERGGLSRCAGRFVR